MEELNDRLKESASAHPGGVPDQAIFFMVGNHEERLEKYMRVKAPELLDCEAFKIEELLDLRSWASM